MMILGRVTVIAFRDWQDLGYDRYQADAQKVSHKLVPNSLRGEGNNQYSSSFEAKYNRPKNNWEYYDKLVDTHKERNKRI